MERDRLKRLYDLHSWTGVLLGLFMFVVAFSGATAVFRFQLEHWEDVAAQRVLPDQPIKIDTVFENRIEEIERTGDTIAFAGVNFPTAEAPYYVTRINARDNETGEITQHNERWDAATGEPVADRGHGAARWLFSIHTRLMLSNPLGASLVGLAGLAMTLSIVTGLLTHRKLVREAMTWRLGRSVRLRWQDTHKVIGLWLAPFHLVMAASGALIGLATVLVIAVGLLAFKGDTEALRAAMANGVEAPSGRAAEMIPVSRAASIADAASGEPTQFLNIYNYGDDNALYRVYFAPAKELSLYGNVDIDGATGAVRRFSTSLRDGSGGKALAMATAFHYGQYGGPALLIIYGLSGAALCIVIATGLMMWIEKRKFSSGRTRPLAFYDRLSGLIVGVTCGQALASAAILPMDRLVAPSPDDRIGVVGSFYLVVWALACGYAVLRRADYLAVRELLAASSILLILTPLVVAGKDGLDAVSVFSEAHDDAAVFSWGLLALGVAGLFACRQLPASRGPKSEGGKTVRPSRIQVNAPAE